MSRVLLCCVALAALLVSGCGEKSDGPSAGKETSSAAVDVATKEQAQALVNAAERDLLANPTAEYEVIWKDRDNQQTMATGAFDLAVPAALQRYMVPGAAVDYRMIAGHVWSQVTGDGIVPDLIGCWMHFTTGTGDQAAASAVPPTANMLLEPSAVGLVDGTGDLVRVDLLLDEAAPAMMPKIVNQLDSPIDPAATVPGVVTVTDGRYAAVEFGAADVLARLDADQLPAEVLAIKDMADSLRIRVEYRGFGAKIVVEPPAAKEVIEVGSQSDLLANGPDPETEIETCAANR